MSKKRAATGKRRAQPQEPKDPVTKALKADFDATHAASIRALRKHDFETVARGIDREKELIGKQRAHILTARAKQAERSK